jgi:hypothetical protein
MHHNRSIHNLQNRAQRDQNRKDDIDRVSASNASRADSHDDKPRDTDERFDASGNQVESRAELVGSCQADFDECEDEAEGCEGDYYAEDRADDGSVRSLVWWC